jgi:hypothetical protein
MTVAVFPAAASACSCAEITRDTIGAKEVAIVAKLKSVKPLEEEGGPTIGPPADFRFRVVEILKGKRRIDKRQVSVRSWLDSGANCGMDDTKGRYGLVLERRGGHWRGSACSTTSPSALRGLFEGSRANWRPNALRVPREPPWGCTRDVRVV